MLTEPALIYNLKSKPPLSLGNTFNHSVFLFVIFYFSSPLVVILYASPRFLQLVEQLPRSHLSQFPNDKLAVSQSGYLVGKTH